MSVGDQKRKSTVHIRLTRMQNKVIFPCSEVLKERLKKLNRKNRKLFGAGIKDSVVSVPALKRESKMLCKYVPSHAPGLPRVLVLVLERCVIPATQGNLA